MRVGLCGVEEKDRKQLLSVVEAALSSRTAVFDTREYAVGTSLLDDVQDEEGIDVVFLLIGNDKTEMLSLARTLRNTGFEGELVLCASDGCCAVEGYELGVGAYLLCPYTVQQVKACFDRLYGASHKPCLTVRRHQAIIRIPYHDIMYVESNNSKCFIHRRTQQHVVYERLDEIEERLRDDRFLRCHQSYLVNMDYVSCADDQFRLINGEAVGIRRRDHKQLRDRYLAYLQMNDKNIDIHD